MKCRFCFAGTLAGHEYDRMRFDLQANTFAWLVGRYPSFGLGIFVCLEYRSSAARALSD